MTYLDVSDNKFSGLVDPSSLLHMPLAAGDSYLDIVDKYELRGAVSKKWILDKMWFVPEEE